MTEPCHRQSPCQGDRSDRPGIWNLPLRRWASKAWRLLKQRFYADPRGRTQTITAFTRLFYDAHDLGQTWGTTSWLGVPLQKNPLDLWIYQELLYLLRPGAVLETGTFQGGSALYLASLCDLLGQGRVVTCDLHPRPGRPVHPRLTYLTGSSIDPAVLTDMAETAAAATRAGLPVMVILDSDHRCEHVLAELHAYAPLVTPGSYLIVEDTAVNGHPVAHEHGPGPWEAVALFCHENRAFAPDPGCEKYLLTFNPRGFLRRQQ